MRVYTGTQVWEGPPRITESRKGRIEHGPGLYFTTRLETARKYAGGKRTVLVVDIDPNFVWLEDAVIPLDEMLAWVDGRRGLKGKKEIMADMISRSRCGYGTGAEVPCRVSLMVNLLVNAGAITGSHGPALAEFLASHGIGGDLVQQHNEDWVVIFDPTKVLSWRRISTDDSENLPLVRRR